MCIYWELVAIWSSWFIVAHYQSEFQEVHLVYIQTFLITVCFAQGSSFSLRIFIRQVLDDFNAPLAKYIQAKSKVVFLILATLQGLVSYFLVYCYKIIHFNTDSEESGILTAFDESESYFIIF